MQLLEGAFEGLDQRDDHVGGVWWAGGAQGLEPLRVGQHPATPQGAFLGVELRLVRQLGMVRLMPGLQEVIEQRRRRLSPVAGQVDLVLAM